jgi:hypothetical protein
MEPPKNSENKEGILGLGLLLCFVGVLGLFVTAILGIWDITDAVAALKITGTVWIVALFVFLVAFIMD